MFMPFQILGIWFRAIFSMLLIGGAIGLLRDWYEHRTYMVYDAPAVSTQKAVLNPVDRSGAPAVASEVETTTPRSTLVHWRFGWNGRTAELLAGIFMSLWAIGGGTIFMPIIRRRGTDKPTSFRGGEVHQVRGISGNLLNVEIYGSADAPPIVLTHGWGCDATVWCYLREKLAKGYRVIVWDLPGLGLSQRPLDNDWSLEKLASDLNEVLKLANDRPAVLVGHSIGGMISLTFCKIFPDALGSRVSGIVLTNTTYTDPSRTTKLNKLMTALEKPVLIPLCYLMIPMAPLLWLSNLLSYLNGSLHRSAERSGFSSNETYEQLDFAARFNVKAWPAVIARGMLAMTKYDATPVLDQIKVPTLIIAGDKDDTTTLEAGKYMHDRIPNSTLQVFSPAKHMGYFEHHERFALLVETFMIEASHVGQFS